MSRLGSLHLDAVEEYTGLPWGQGDWSLLSSAEEDAVWMVVEVDSYAIVNIDEEV